MKFYIEYPKGEYGNTLHPPAIIQAEVIEKGKIDSRIQLIAPEEFKNKWPTLNTGGSGLVEVPASFGPARMLSNKEHKLLWQRYQAEISHRASEPAPEEEKRAENTYDLLLNSLPRLHATISQFMLSKKREDASEQREGIPSEPQPSYESTSLSK